ncbi:hypothetical protein MJO28_017414 [Puccinia striiformis f. sp. tritici]|nr:hypothetical protein MJO28_017414 [Puccinia striiformis f. sp. tritici]
MDQNFLSSIQDFTSNGLTLKEPSEMDWHVLNGWGRATLKGYNSAVRKFLVYMRSVGRRFRLPAQADDIFNFCFWCGKSTTKEASWEISAVTLRKYLSGLKAWHDYHGLTYPVGIDRRVGLMVKSSAKEDARQPMKCKKSAIKLQHLLTIADTFSKGSEEDMAILDLSLVAFWGMARLGEITYDNQTIHNAGPKKRDVTISSDGQSAVIKLRNAKTAIPGELQYIRLTALRNALCPVLAIQRRMNSCKGLDDAVFGFQTLTGHSILTKSWSWSHRGVTKIRTTPVEGGKTFPFYPNTGVLITAIPEQKQRLLQGAPDTRQSWRDTPLEKCAKKERRCIGQYDEALIDGAQFKTGQQLRLMFAIILVHSPPAAPVKLFEDHWRNLGNDVPHLLASKYNLLNVSNGQVKAFTLHLVDQILHSMGLNLGLVCLKLDSRFKTFFKYVSVGGTTSDTCVNIEERLWVNEDLLNGGQKIFYQNFNQLLMTCDRTPFTLYLDGPGGTGKTFLLNTLVDSLVVAGKHPVVVAPTGVAALLLSGGQTAHSGLGIPIKLTLESKCKFTRENRMGQRLANTRVILWDEAVAVHKYAIEAVDRSLKKLMEDDRPFGGKSIVFAGDFRQTLLVVKDGVYPASEHATFKSSSLWKGVKTFSLADNMHVEVGLEGRNTAENLVFAQNLLAIGKGLCQQEDAARIEVPGVKVKSRESADKCFGLAIAHVSSGIEHCQVQAKGSLYEKYLSERCILCPLNADAPDVNGQILESMKGEDIKSHSIDWPNERASDALPEETLNKLSFAGFLEHKLKLKKGIPVVLLRNLNISEGLFNGTQLKVEKSQFPI